MAKKVIEFPCYIGDKIDYQGQVIEINEIYLDKNICNGSDIVTYLCHFDCDNMDCSQCRVGKNVLMGEEWECDSLGTFSFTSEDIGNTVIIIEDDREVL